MLLFCYGAGLCAMPVVSSVLTLVLSVVGAISGDGAQEPKSPGADSTRSTSKPSSAAAGKAAYDNLAELEQDAEPYQVADCNLALFEVWRVPLLTSCPRLCSSTLRFVYR